MWDYNRVRSLLETVECQIRHMFELHDKGEPEEAPWDEMFSTVNLIDRDVSTVKALLKRQRSKRA
jgi:hypothetical protein